METCPLSAQTAPSSVSTWAIPSTLPTVDRVTDIQVSSNQVLGEISLFGLLEPCYIFNQVDKLSGLQHDLPCKTSFLYSRVLNPLLVSKAELALVLREKIWAGSNRSALGSLSSSQRRKKKNPGIQSSTPLNKGKKTLSKLAACLIESHIMKVCLENTS